MEDDLFSDRELMNFRFYSEGASGGTAICNLRSNTFDINCLYACHGFGC